MPSCWSKEAVQKPQEQRWNLHAEKFSPDLVWNVNLWKDACRFSVQPHRIFTSVGNSFKSAVLSEAPQIWRYVHTQTATDMNLYGSKNYKTDQSALLHVCEKHGGRVWCHTAALCRSSSRLSFDSAAAKPEQDGERPRGRQPVLFSAAHVRLPHAGQSVSTVMFSSDCLLAETNPRLDPNICGFQKQSVWCGSSLCGSGFCSELNHIQYEVLQVLLPLVGLSRYKQKYFAG